MQKRILYHFIFWVAYVLLKAYINFDAGVLAKEDDHGIPFFALSVAAQFALLLVKIPLTYSLFLLADKYITKQWSVYKVILSGILVMAIGIIGFIYVNYYIVVKGIYKYEYTVQHLVTVGSIFSAFIVLLLVSGIAMAVKLVRSNLRQRENEQEIIKKKLETELQFLKAQTNPHFLFNTLNNIYALARKKADTTAGAVMKLSELLRFMLYESQKKSIPLSDEIQVLNNYIELEKIRYNEKLELNFTKTVDNEWQPIAPLILLPFVENAFKHGASESRFGSFINISLSLENEILHFTVENSIAEDIEKKQLEKIGLKNVRRQLELMYPHHSLFIANENNVFKVKLEIDLSESEINTI